MAMLRPYTSAHTDSQQQVAISIHMMCEGGLQRSTISGLTLCRLEDYLL